MDAGIIMSFKKAYKKSFIRRLVDFLDQNQKAPLLNVLEAINFTTSAWLSVTKETIAGCWRHVGLLPCDGSAEAPNDDDSELIEGYQRVSRALSEHERLDLNAFLRLDNQEPTEGMPSDEDILTEALPAEERVKQEEEDEEDEDELPPPRQVSAREALQGMESALLYLQQQGAPREEIVALISLKDFLARRASCSLKQTTIESFFHEIRKQ
jgi:hypothetical protein